MWTTIHQYPTITITIITTITITTTTLILSLVLTFSKKDSHGYVLVKEIKGALIRSGNNEYPMIPNVWENVT